MQLRLGAALIALTIAGLEANAAPLESIEADIAKARYTVELTNAITKYASQYNLERRLLSCLIYVESSYNMGVISETEDYGLAQINIKTIRGYSFDRLRLLSDVGYSVKAAAEVLADFKRYFGTDEPNAWPARYNIGFQSLTKAGIGAAYVQYNKKLQTCMDSGTHL